MPKLGQINLPDPKEGEEIDISGLLTAFGRLYDANKKAEETTSLALRLVESEIAKLRGDKAGTLEKKLEAALKNDYFREGLEQLMTRGDL